MAVYPGAVFKPTPFGGRTLRNRQGRGILHVAVSGARSLPPWNGNTWHLYVADDGYCEQYVDSAFRAYAALDANDDAILIETQGGLGSSAQLNAEPWTPAAAARIADIMRWAHETEDIPLEVLPDSKPGRRGWGPHRLGITHSRGLGKVPGWRVPGGESWSSAIGKECPGDAKVAQIPELIRMARTGQAMEDDMNASEVYEAVRPHFEWLADQIGPRTYEANRPHAEWTVATLQGQVVGLRSALEAVAANPGAAVDLEAVFKAAQDGARSIVDNLRVVAEPAPGPTS